MLSQKALLSSPSILPNSYWSSSQMGQSRIAIVGEAWGAEEEIQRAPFVGASGWELTKMLSEAGIHRADCFLTNCFNLRPQPSNDIENLCTSKSDGLTKLGPL